MDEYRPFPAEEPAELPGPPAAEDLSDAPAPHPRATPELETDTPADAERPEPNTDHPGGHLHGAVARLNRPRRFGFLRADDGVEVFFHASAIDTGPNAFDALRPGQEVEFDCHQDEQGRGLAASLVTVTGEPPVEAARPPRGQRAERSGRGGRAATAGGSAGAEKWHVAVLHERYDAPVASQLERLLNERGVKPGHFSLHLVEREAGTECWVAYHTGDDQRREGRGERQEGR